MKRTLLSSAILMLALPGIAAAGSPISENRNVNADARIDVSNIKGQVTVSGWDKPQVSITGTLGDGARSLSIEGGADMQPLGAAGELLETDRFVQYGLNVLVGIAWLVVKQAQVPDPGHLAVLAGPVVVRAAPIQRCTSSTELPSASSGCCDSPTVESFHLHTVK